MIGCAHSVPKKDVSPDTAQYLIEAGMWCIVSEVWQEETIYCSETLKLCEKAYGVVREHGGRFKIKAVSPCHFVVSQCLAK